MFSRTQSASLPRRAPLDQRTWTAPEKQRRLAPMAQHQRPTPQALPEPRRRSGALEALPGRGAAREPEPRTRGGASEAPGRGAGGRGGIAAPGSFPRPERRGVFEPAKLGGEPARAPRRRSRDPARRRRRGAPPPDQENAAPPATKPPLVPRLELSKCRGARPSIAAATTPWNTADVSDMYATSSSIHGPAKAPLAKARAPLAPIAVPARPRRENTRPW